jgi:uncharacterized membrane-anchored protein
LLLLFTIFKLVSGTVLMVWYFIVFLYIFLISAFDSQRELTAVIDGIYSLNIRMHIRSRYQISGVLYKGIS